MKFELDTTDGRARRGRLVFDRGVVERLFYACWHLRHRKRDDAGRS